MMEPDFTKPVDILAFLLEKFGICDCSETELVLELIEKVLLWAAEDVESRSKYHEIFEHLGHFYIIAGILDNSGLLNHGIAIRHSWITETGRVLLHSIQNMDVNEIDEAKGMAYDGCQY